MSCSLEQRRAWIQPRHRQLSVSRQCQLLGLATSSYYYVARPESAQNLQYMRWLDEEYTRHPFYGVRKMTAWLQQRGQAVGLDRVRLRSIIEKFADDQQQLGEVLGSGPDAASLARLRSRLN